MQRFTIFLFSFSSAYAALRSLEDVKSSLASGETLDQDESLQSPDQNFNLLMQSDGNLVLCHHFNNVPVWSSKTANTGSAPYRLVLQNDCNMVIYASTEAIWSSTSSEFLCQGSDQGTASFQVQNDGNMVIYRSIVRPVWDQRGNSVIEVNFYDHEINRKLLTTNDTVVSVLTAGKSIQTDERISSPDNKYYLTVQKDGNVVLYHFFNNVAVWSTGTQNQGLGPYTLTMQGDCNLVLYDQQDGSSLWATNTVCSNTADSVELRVQNDNNVVLYKSMTRAYWASNSDGNIHVTE